MLLPVGLGYELEFASYVFVCAPSGVLVQGVCRLALFGAVYGDVIDYWLVLIYCSAWAVISFISVCTMPVCRYLREQSDSRIRGLARSIV